MKINKTKKGYHYLNIDNVVVKTSWVETDVEEGNPHHGVGDSLGRNAYASLIFDEDEENIINGIKSYFSYDRTSPETGFHWYVGRYPRGFKYALRGNSRDHVVKAIASLYLLGEDDFVKDYIKHRAKRPCIDHPFTLDQKLWFKSLYSHFWSWVYVLIYIPKVIFRRLGMWLLRLLTIRHLRFAKDLNDFIENRPIPKNKWAKFVSKKQLIYPTYALLYGCVVANAMKSQLASKFIKIMQRMFIDPGNLVIKGLCGIKITEKELNNYIPSQNNRWSTRLDFTCDRDMIKYNGDNTDNVYNALLYKIFENQNEYGKWYALGKKK